MSFRKTSASSDTALSGIMLVQEKYCVNVVLALRSKNVIDLQTSRPTQTNPARSVSGHELDNREADEAGVLLV